MKTLMSAAHAAGYAMATEDVVECRPVPVAVEPAKGTALVVHEPSHLWSEIHAFLRFDWLRGRFAAHWHGGAAA